jgi:enoyl-CoA hydratase/carnithine racemase
MQRPGYFDAFDQLTIDRDESNGVLTVRMHTRGGPCVFSLSFVTQCIEALHRISNDPDNRVLIWTGTGLEWMSGPDFGSFGDVGDPNLWDTVSRNVRKALFAMLDLDMPIVSAVNGPAHLHSEWILTHDIVLATPQVSFCDRPHLTFGIAPGDGMHVLWPEALGTSRARYFLWMQEVISAEAAKELGVVHELVAQQDLAARANAVAKHLASQPTLNLRYTRQALTQRLKRLLLEGLGHGLALEGLTAVDLARRQSSK